ncbi:MAG: NADH-quinone oxidoreductase subunit C [bacterium]|nr:NADH-quinone oxidoreductase subunit C [bacterium]
MTFLRDEPALAFDMLIDLTCVDYLGREPRFEMVYHLYSVTRNHRLRIKAGVSEESATIGSVTGLWAAADWMEREVFDLYGIVFENHPDLRRILLDEGFEGHPLRKDYPKTRRQPLIGRRSRDA